MFSLKKHTENNLHIWEFADGKGTRASLIPERGGILSEFFIGGNPMFYLDKTTLYEHGKNVRGGNPVLFPICGPLQNDKYSLDGREFQMKQHGFARNMKWDVVDTLCCKDSCSITLELVNDESSIKAYPFEFRLLFTYQIHPDNVTIEQKYLNKSHQEIPFYAGFHPYFFAPGDKAVALGVPSDSVYDVKTGIGAPFSGKLDLHAKPETNLVFSGLKEQEAWFDRTDGFRVKVKFDSSFNYIVLWALRDKDFLCIEPWMGNNYDMNEGRAPSLKPGEELTAVVSYAIEKLL